MSLPDKLVDELRRHLRPLPPAGRLDAIVKLMATEEDVRCPVCGGCGTVKRPKTPVITREQAVRLLETT